jgi:hypothetical protein
MILILKSKNLCYNSTGYFADILCDALEKSGYEADICDISDCNFNPDNCTSEAYSKLVQACNKLYDAIIDFNSTLPLLKNADGSYFLNTLSTPFFNYLLDHPLYYHDCLLPEIKNYFVLCIDKDHVDYIREFYPHIQGVTFLPLAAMRTTDDCIDYEQRPISLLFTGTYTSPHYLDYLISGASSEFQSVVFSLIDIMKADSSISIEKAFALYLAKENKNISNANHAAALNQLYIADTYMHAYSRDIIIRHILNQGIAVEAYGNGWKELTATYPSTLHEHPPISFAVSLMLLGKSKMSLNILPAFKSGPHDRIFSAMYNKTLCVTDTNSYLDTAFSDNELLRIPNTDSAVLDKICLQIQQLQKQPELAKPIINRAYDNVCTNHLWENRIKTLLPLIKSAI